MEQRSCTIGSTSFWRKIGRSNWVTTHFENWRSKLANEWDVYECLNGSLWYESQNVWVCKHFNIRCFCRNQNISPHHPIPDRNASELLRLLLFLDRRVRGCSSDFDFVYSRLTRCSSAGRVVSASASTSCVTDGPTALTARTKPVPPTPAPGAASGVGAAGGAVYRGRCAATVRATAPTARTRRPATTLRDQVDYLSLSLLSDVLTNYCSYQY